MACSFNSTVTVCPGEVIDPSKEIGSGLNCPTAFSVNGPTKMSGKHELARGEVAVGNGEVLDAFEADTYESAGDAQTISGDADARPQRRVAVGVEHLAGDAAGAASEPDVCPRGLSTELDCRRDDVAVGETGGERRHLNVPAGTCSMR